MVILLKNSNNYKRKANICMEEVFKIVYDVNNRKKGGKIYEEKNGEKADLGISCFCNGSFYADCMRGRVG